MEDEIDCACCQCCGCADSDDCEHRCPHGITCDIASLGFMLCARCESRGLGCPHTLTGDHMDPSNNPPVKP